MFVICNALDQISMKLKRDERFIEAIKHAGPSITITSLTDCLAFFAGSQSKIVGIKNFCIYASVTVAMLYLTVMTVFLCILYWDTYRASKRCKECCGLCFCKEDTILCCGGIFLANNQREFSGIPLLKSNDDDQNGSNKEAIASHTERILFYKIAPFILNPKIKYLILLIFAGFTVSCVFSILDMRTYFAWDLFFTPAFTQYKWNQMFRKYYGYTYQPVFYVNLNGTVDFYQEDVQLQQYMFEDELQKCISCDKQWFLPHTLDSWYSRFREYLANGNCFYARDGIDPFKNYVAWMISQ